ncbi:MAG TPA: glycoside hydrolase family 13 protein [Candidatus Sulfomarinibacteraceae bacterium]|nr:glycoside hydrolase family 13 protein [Candidatus Sulfomarinibacteraceae bacterium]
MNIQTPEWVKDAIFYQIFPDRFARSERVSKPNNLQAWEAPPTYNGFKGGDLLGIVEKLDYLVDLGINAIYLNPIFTSASNHRYHTHDYYQVDPLLGGNAAFHKLLQAAHERNMRIVLDGVFNHASRGFFQFNHLLETGAESPYRDWFHVYDWPLNAYNENEQPNYAAWWGLHALPKFNTDNPDVREFLWNVGTYWVEQGIDGWRLDVPAEIDDDEFWREFRRRCRKVNPQAYLVGELWDDAGRWLQGDQFDAQMNYPFTRAAFGFFGGDNLNQSDTIHTGLGYLEPCHGHRFADTLDHLHQRYDWQIILSQMNMLSSHDTPRLYTIANGDLSTVRLMFLCQMTVAGAPNIYYGDEIGLPGNRDPDCRRAFPWDNRKQWKVDLLEVVRSFIRLRRAAPVLRRGDFHILFASEQIVVYRRQLEGHTAVIAFNAGQGKHAFELTGDQLPEKLDEALVEDGVPLQAKKKIVLAPRSGRVWVSKGALVE